MKGDSHVPTNSNHFLSKFMWIKTVQEFFCNILRNLCFFEFLLVGTLDELRVNRSGDWTKINLKNVYFC